MGLSDDAIRGIKDSIPLEKVELWKLPDQDAFWGTIRQELTEATHDLIDEFLKLEKQYYIGLAQVYQAIIENQLREKGSHGNQEAEA